MNKTNLVEILSSFSNEELLRFKDFVCSPYHNKIKNLEKLFLILYKYSPEFRNDNLDKEIVWNKLFPDKKYNYGIMKNLIHELTKLAEDFIVLEYSSANELKKYYELIDILYERKILKTFASKMNAMSKVMNKHFLKNDINTIEEEFFLLFNIYGVKLSSAHLLKDKIDFKKDSRTIFELMISCFLIYVYKLYCNITVFKESDTDRNQDKSLLEVFLRIFRDEEIYKILNYQGNHNNDYLKIMNAYFRVYKTINQSDVDSYMELKKSVSDITGLIRGQYLFDLFINLNNALMKLKSGSVDFTKEYFEIYNKSIENNCFLHVNGTLSDIAFIRHILFAFTIKDAEEIENFSKMYTGKLHENSRENCYNFAISHVNFLKSNYTNSLQHISKINTNHAMMKLALKDLKIMNYFELNDYESFLYVMDSYKHFINYKNNPDILKKYEYGFCLKIKKLFELKNNPDKFESDKMRREEIVCILTSKKWLLEKLDELQNK